MRRGFLCARLFERQHALRKGLEETENVREWNTTRMLKLDNKEEILLQERLKMYAAIPRKVVAKLHATIRKENMGYDQYTVPDWL